MNTKKAALTVISIALKIVIFAALVVVLLRIGSVAYEYGHAVFEEEALDEAPGTIFRFSVRSIQIPCSRESTRFPPP